MTRDEAEDIKRYFDVVSERTDSHIRQVAEGVNLANERIDRLDTRMDGFETRMDRLEMEMRRGFSELGSMIKLSYAQIDGRLTRVEAECAELRSRIEKVEAKLAS
jgi:chromosome segregation ATPase